MLKILALILMVMDHSAIFFFPEYTFFLRGIGQIGFPLFCYLIVQGHKYTKDLNLYLISIILCAAITQPLYSVLFPDLHRLNDLFTLLSGLILIILYEKYGFKAFLLLAPLVMFNVVSFYIVLIFIIYFCQNDKHTMFFFSFLFYIISYYLSGQISYILFGPLFVLFLIRPLPRFNINKYFFYAFYPGHYLIILFLDGLSI